MISSHLLSTEFPNITKIHSPQYLFMFPQYSLTLASCPPVSYCEKVLSSSVTASPWFTWFHVAHTLKRPTKKKPDVKSKVGQLFGYFPSCKLGTILRFRENKNFLGNLISLFHVVWMVIGEILKYFFKVK